VDERRRATAAARDHLAAGLRTAGLEPLASEANFLLVEHGADDDALADRLLRRGVLVRPGGELGLPGWARITVGPRPLMDRALEALPAVLAELNPARARAR
jgi:histidinol-phosphate aminotransferase